MDIALDVIQMKEDGKSLKEIRAGIDEEYGKLGYEATDTPYPE